MSIFDQLAAPFPRGAVHWRAQSVTKDGSKAMALAYIDARNVMDRLDEVCGPGGWQDTYVETARGRVVCTISIKVDGEWIAKSDGAGDTAVEGEKGGISDAFKRAAVKWGVGRYLYSLDAPWVPCECTEYNGKKQWKKWTGDPWRFVRNAPDEPTPEPRPERKAGDPKADAQPATQAAADVDAELDEIATQFPGMSEGFYRLVQKLWQAQTTQAYKSWETKSLSDIGKLETHEVNELRAECERQKDRIRQMNQIAA